MRKAPVDKIAGGPTEEKPAQRALICDHIPYD